jgi:hypothetical protein
VFGHPFLLARIARFISTRHGTLHRFVSTELRKIGFVPGVFPRHAGYKIFKVLLRGAELTYASDEECLIERDNERLKAMVVAGTPPERAISSLEAAIEPTCPRLCANHCDQLDDQ